MYNDSTVDGQRPPLCYALSNTFLEIDFPPVFSLLRFIVALIQFASHKLTTIGR